ncbi:tRNA pseudouridine(55) synthase TruB [Lederbergia sp. NSJ-179]|uniref:tRNA pseudouridine(55) synthase TruB n=1 Tax=Lederbergia sp. NSJ-179 TaxID=2931402 RepID=UPI001FD31904|nr:tRNA pseudouridine(55) synthase TruB [Lederbergia sp. NSJ-179]MCJ7839683.1 tRNA pseudouridine(55) synthase TruB [Lederbergia sp. NSJ-179]
MDGILPLWKPKGLTSHDCVFKIRKLLKMKKVGHTGTLDPGVDGVLPICLGKATKIAEYITDAGKVYEGEVTLGTSTTTEDAYGEVLEVKKVEASAITIPQIQQIFHELTGEIEQIPPLYSAVKVNGKKLYEYARAGIHVERPKRKIHIYDLRLLHEEIEWQAGEARFSFRVHCSKGTYIRTLAVMIGEKLGYPAHMSSLTRTASASFTRNECVTFKELEQCIKEDHSIEKMLFPLEKGLSYLQMKEINEPLLKRILDGAVLPIPENWPQGPVVLVYHHKAYAIYDIHPNKSDFIKPVKVIRNVKV